MEFETKKTFSEILIPIKTAIAKYFYLFWAPAIAISILMLLISAKIPDYFSSSAVIFIQPQKVKVKMLQNSTEKKEQEEQFEALIQEMISRPRLLSIIDKFKLYPSFKGLKGKEKALIKMRGAIDIAPVISPSGKVLTQTFKLNFVHNDAKTAYNVADSLSQLFINESTLSEMSKTRGTEEFIDANLREQRTKLTKIEEKRKVFARKYSNQLPEYRVEALARLNSSQKQFSYNTQLLKSNLSRIQFLRDELRVVQKSVAQNSVNNSVSSSDPRIAIAKLKQSIKILKSKYSDRHPDVVAAQRRIDSLEGQAGSSGRKSISVSSTVVNSNPQTRLVARELNELEVQTGGLKSENEKLKLEIDELKENIKLMPIRETELSEIERDYVNLKESYQRLLEAKENASLQSSLVKSQKGTQFKIVDPASIPLVPSGPTRWVIALGGLVTGLAIMFGLPILFYYLNGSLKSREEAESELGLPVIGIIPPLLTSEVVSQKTRTRRLSVFASMVSLVLGVLLIILVF